MIDSRGSPLICSGIVSYKIVDARSAIIRVANLHKYIGDIAPAMLKGVLNKYPFESRASEAEDMSLRGNIDEVGVMMREALQSRVQLAGVRIESFQIDELSYAPEVAQVMLKKQQAEALIDARRSVVEGAKEIALNTVGDLSDHVSEGDRSRLLANLLVVLVGQQEVQPTLTIG